MKARRKAKGRPGKIGPAASRCIYSRPPLGDSTQVMGMSKSKAKPSEGTPQGPVDRGFAADYFGASPVASALNLPRERDSPENRNQTTMLSPPARSKPDISTLQGIGHFYFALTLGPGQAELVFADWEGLGLHVIYILPHSVEQMGAPLFSVIERFAALIPAIVSILSECAKSQPEGQ
jgi:hypothetical protein